ncbi:RDD family protein [Enterovibrio norvegicus]|uniref:RDD family protein n=1 Tax=Enterovibrio norvegicus TaxID=188144 RepID=UPI00035E1A69|nr:RDD family protein [Enterovibrio norvegicus]
MEKKEPHLGNFSGALEELSGRPEEGPFETPDFSTAPLRDRFLAQMADSLISGLIFIGVFYILSEAKLDTESVRIYSLAFSVSYYLLSDSLPKGRSLGKWVFKISVIDKKTGAYCSLVQSFFRNLLCITLGFIDSAFILGKKRRRLGDLLARTIVIKDS